MSVTFGSVTLNYIESFTPSSKAHRAKQTLGKRVIMNNIIDTSTNDNILDMRGRLVRTTAALLKTAQAALATIDDGAKHAYADTSDNAHDGDYVIDTNTLRFERQINPLNVKFSLRLIEW